jgi:hypothetical protein
LRKKKKAVSLRRNSNYHITPRVYRIKTDTKFYRNIAIPFSRYLMSVHVAVTGGSLFSRVETLAHYIGFWWSWSYGCSSGWLAGASGRGVMATWLEDELSPRTRELHALVVIEILLATKRPSSEAQRLVLISSDGLRFRSYSY